MTNVERLERLRDVVDATDRKVWTTTDLDRVGRELWAHDDDGDPDEFDPDYFLGLLGIKRMPDASEEEWKTDDLRKKISRVIELRSNIKTGFPGYDNP